jgi:adenine-specific DNA methylase
MNRARALEIAAERAAVFRQAGDPALRSSAWWLARAMLEMDWVERHEFYRQMARTKPKRFVTMLERCMSPQDLLKGKRTGMMAPWCLVMLDKTRKRQMKIEDFFVAKRPS